jgi:hypothetical protein
VQELKLPSFLEGKVSLEDLSFFCFVGEESVLGFLFSLNYTTTKTPKERKIGLSSPPTIKKESETRNLCE